MGYKPSRYNVLVPYENNTHLLFNSLTNALASLDEDNYRSFQAFLAGQEDLSEEFLQQLVYCGYLIEEDYDELVFFRRKMFEERFSRHSIGLTVAPTMKCNFNCDYCFETGVRDGKMEKETIEQLLKFLEKRHTHEKALILNWMGGEPLLAIDVMEDITAGCKALCEKKNMAFSSRLVTNGYLLTPQLAEKMVKDLGISYIQITLDGMGENHNRKRPLLNGGPTFDTIVHNIFSIMDIVQDMVIRINLDQENIGDADLMMDMFERYKHKVHLTFSLMNPVSDETRDRCLSLQQYSQINQEIRGKKLARGFAEHFYPVARFNPCGVTMASSFVVDPKGRLFKCWSDFGFYERSIGHISETTTPMQAQLESKCLLFDPTENEKCLECKVLPLCVGGCYWKRDYTIDEPCSLSKFDLEESLKTYVKNRLYETTQKEVS